MRNNTKNETNADFNFARCRNCRFPLDRTRDETTLKSTISYTTGVNSLPLTFPFVLAEKNWKYPTINSGCPLCGCPQPYK